jgi:hypothetical protein
MNHQLVEERNQAQSYFLWCILFGEQHELLCMLFAEPLSEGGCQATSHHQKVIIRLLLLVFDATQVLFSYLHYLVDKRLIIVNGAGFGNLFVLHVQGVRRGRCPFLGTEIVSQVLFNKLVELNPHQSKSVCLGRQLHVFLIFLLDLRHAYSIEKTANKKENVHVLIEVSLSSFIHHFFKNRSFNL